MKKILTVFTILFTVTFSQIIHAEWKHVVTSAGLGNKFYVETTSIKKNNGFLYYWLIIDKVKPDVNGDLSTKALYELSCNAPIKQVTLALSIYKNPMAKGQVSMQIEEHILIEDGAQYVSPGSVNDIIAKFVCKN